MNEKRSAFVGLLLLMVVISTGYALFSGNVTVGGTAEAKGELKISSNCTPGISEATKVLMEQMGDYNGDLNGIGFENDSCNVNGNIVNYAATLKYPSAFRYFTVKYTNTGQIPFVIKGVNEKKEFIQDDKHVNYDWDMATAFPVIYNGNIVRDFNFVVKPNDTIEIVLQLEWPSSEHFNPPSIDMNKPFKSINNLNIDIYQSNS